MPCLALCSATGFPPKLHPPASFPCRRKPCGFRGTRVLLILVLLFAGTAWPQGWEEWEGTCADAPIPGQGEEGWRDEGGRGFDADPVAVPVAVEDCDPDEALLFPLRPAVVRARESNRASYSVTHAPGGTVQSVLRHRAEQHGWDHRLEVRGDTLVRRRLGWNTGGWRLLAGELTDTVLPPWPRTLPRRALPVGWKPAHDHPAASSRLQGLGAAVTQPGWKAYAMRAWNPVETGREPPWHSAWNLRHFAAGASVSLPWTAALHLSETRVTRGDSDSLSERLLAAGLQSPGGDLDLVVARSESGEAEGPGRSGKLVGMARAGKSGWMIGADLRHVFRDGFKNPFTEATESARGATVELTLRQRDAAWLSAWDPAFTATAYTAAAAVTDPENHEADSSDRDWGAGEARLALRLPLAQDGARGSLRTEAWRVWNPVGTDRQGVRGTFGWRRDDARLELAGTHRTSRTTSGSISLYRYLRAETRLARAPGWRVAAWRAWNRNGPLRTGLFFGAEPERGDWKFRPGFRLEALQGNTWSGIATLGFHWRMGPGWNLDAAGSLPCLPAPSPEVARWRVTLNRTR